jgi:transcriptional regulator with XRE-family HTH domain
MIFQYGIFQIGFYVRAVARALHSPANVKLRELMHRARLGVGLTQAELAATLGQSQSFVSKYESGERQLSVVEFLRVCKALGTSPARIVSKVAEEEPWTGARSRT